MTVYGEGFALGLRGVDPPPRPTHEFMEGWRAGYSTRLDDSRCAVCRESIDTERDHVAFAPTGAYIHGHPSPCHAAAWSTERISP